MLPLATFIARRQATTAPWSHPLGTTPSGLPIRAGVEELIDTVTAIQRAEWLEDGVYLGPNVFASVFHDLHACARVLGVQLPPAIISPIPARSQQVLGTDSRAFLHLSSFFVRTAPTDERRFLLGRLLGPIATRTVTAHSLYGLLVDDGGLRTLARRTLGPTVEVVLTPASFATRLLLSRSERAAEISHDRAGMLCAGSVDAAGRALLRMALGVTPDVAPEAYLAQLDASASRSPGRWTELFSSSPWTHTRIRALHTFAESAAWSRATGETPPPDALSDDALNRAIDALLRAS